MDARERFTTALSARLGFLRSGEERGIHRCCPFNIRKNLPGMLGKSAGAAGREPGTPLQPTARIQFAGPDLRKPHCSRCPHGLQAQTGRRTTKPRRIARGGIGPARSRVCFEQEISKRHSTFRETGMKSVFIRTMRSLQRSILAGLITIGPLFVTYLVFSFVLSSLAKAGLPLVELLAILFPESWLRHPLLQSILAIVLTVVVLYVVGRVTSLVIGRQAFSLFEATLERLPFVARVYTSVRQLLDTMTAKKESSQRVVLVDFPIAGQKSVGFLTRTLTDAETGTVLAAVLLPNAINPTSAFLQILPLERVTETDLNMEQAMSMLMTGGAVCPETIRFTKQAAGKEEIRPPERVA
jgi:uncharacterized membrane protein